MHHHPHATQNSNTHSYTHPLSPTGEPCLVWSWICFKFDRSQFFTQQTLNVLGVQHSPGLFGSPAAAAAAAAAAALWRHPELATQYITNAAAAAAAAAQVYHVKLMAA